MSRDGDKTAGRSGRPSSGSSGPAPNAPQSAPGEGAARAASGLPSGTPAPGAASGKSAASQVPTGGVNDPDAIDLLQGDHRRVEKLFTEYAGAIGGTKDSIVEQICRELILHARLEEEIFYPACRDAAGNVSGPLDEAQVEHDSAKLLIGELLAGQSGDAFRDAQVNVLAEQVRHHIAEEERPQTGIFAKARSTGVDTATLGRRLQARKQQLQGRSEAQRPSRTVSFKRLSNKDEEGQMAGDNGPGRGGRRRLDGDHDDRGARRGPASDGSAGGSSRR